MSAITEPSDESHSECERNVSSFQLLLEAAAVAAMVVLADLTIYHSYGFAGSAVFFFLAPAVLFAGSLTRRFSRATLLIGAMLAVLGMRLLWQGTPLLVGCGIALVAAFATALADRTPFVMNVVTMAAQSIAAGYHAIVSYFSMLRLPRPRYERTRLLSVLLPSLAVMVFGTIFVFANPDAVTFLGTRIEQTINALRDWLLQFAWRPTELLFWLVVAWLTAGLLKPLAATAPENEAVLTDSSPKSAVNPLYPAFRNTLVAVIVLFTVYLAVEFTTLWFRDFPEGFYYAGYAHEGAAWLTLALGLATIVLSTVFSGAVLGDPRIQTLKRLSWIWSAQNLVLSLAVYNRLFIYIDFNGLTRMRIVGIFGISLVLVGFCLVVYKISRGRSFAWLLQRQLWAFAATIYLFALTPVDRLAVSFNVNQIIDGDSSACMQIGIQPFDTEAALVLPRLLDCHDARIQEGTRALLAARYHRLRARESRSRALGWTTFQWIDRIALRRLEGLKESWVKYNDEQERGQALDRFREYAYQWY